MPLKDPILKTARLVLKRLEISDAGKVQELAGDASIADMTAAIPHPYPDGLAEEWIVSHQAGFEHATDINLGIFDKGAGQLIGCISLNRINRQCEHAEIGYWIGKPFWNKGFGTEAARTVIEFGFLTLGLNRIFAYHFSRNPASGRVLQKSGMIHEGCLRQHFKKDTHFENLEVYAILKNDFMLSWNQKNLCPDRDDARVDKI